ncbi:sensor histidine kinase [Rheinheimera maricola]|uniref:histidine kinase n=1 Tax=Rheinheimera maricola TaxID=2793282 RepID=A0ABS7X5E3_9GAMM|nr:HAMP domain-containing sensor histidine kinase [Rheinheimera maricola]MBZ9610763.1 HAMP domain-containing histidine kinase [Rheinheimera maricola]
MKIAKLSLKNLLILQFVLSATLPTLLLSGLLISEFQNIQTEEQIKKQSAQTEKAKLQLEFELEKFALQLQQLAVDSNAALAASSGIFAHNARNSLLQIAQNHQLAKAVLLVDKTQWIVEAVPVEAMVVPLTPLQPHLEALFAEDYAATNQTIFMSSVELSKQLLANSAPAAQPLAEIIVMQIPLKLADTAVTDPRSRLTGAIVALLPLQNIKTMLENYSPDTTLQNIYWQGRGLITDAKPSSDMMVTQVELHVPNLPLALTVEFATTRAAALGAITALTYRYALITGLFLILLLLAGWLFVRAEVKPITALNRMVEGYADGDLQQPKQQFPFTEFDQIAGVLHTMALKLKEHQDLLERRVAQRTSQLQQAVVELNQINAELLKTQQQLVESEKLSQIGILVAGVSREISDPISQSLAAVNTIQQQHLEIAQAVKHSTLKRSAFDHYLRESKLSIEQLSRNLQRAEELIQSFKAVAVDQSSEQRRNFNLYDYLQQVILSLRYELSRYNVKVDIKGDKVMVLQSYPGTFSRVLTNLVLNTLQHGFDSSVAQHISISYSLLPDGQLQLVYRDDGAGMAKPVLKRIFEPFFTTAQQDGGSGLGMSIVYNLITQQLKGSIDAESEPGKGASFTMTLPVRVVIKPR